MSNWIWSATESGGMPKVFALTGMRDIFLFLSFRRQDELIFFLEARLNLFLHSFNTFSSFYFFPFLSEDWLFFFYFLPFLEASAISKLGFLTEERIHFYKYNCVLAWWIVRVVKASRFRVRSPNATFLFLSWFSWATLQRSQPQGGKGWRTSPEARVRSKNWRTNFSTCSLN